MKLNISNKVFLVCFIFFYIICIKLCANLTIAQKARYKCQIQNNMDENVLHVTFQWSQLLTKRKQTKFKNKSSHHSQDT